MVLLGILISLTSCAVLTVDVDVYKGPLANHEDVQVEQMAAMAIGAKPLLVELRDMLEATGPKGDSTEEKTADGTSRFRNHNAYRVNEILSLYEDQSSLYEDQSEDEQYSILVRRAWQAAKDYKRAYEILRPDSKDAERRLWTQLKLEGNSFRNEAKSLIGNEHSDKVNKLAEKIETLRQDYENFYTRDYRDDKKLLNTWFEIRELLMAANRKTLATFRDDLSLKEKDEELQASSNAAFRALAETSLVAFQAEYLFGLRDKKKEQFVDHVKKVSKAFLDARDALEQLWRVEMETIIWLSEQPPETVLRRGPRRLEIAKASLELVLTQHVVVLANLLDKDDPNVPDGLVQLGRSVETVSKTPWGRKWESTDYEPVKKMLMKEFEEQPAKTARTLLDGHSYSIHQLLPQTLCNKRVKLEEGPTKTKPDPTYDIWHRSGWEFGFARGPFEGLTLPEMTKQVENAFPGGAFAGGRLDKGLETLIEEYLRQANISDPSDDKLVQARECLSDALVGFAEKVLFVANNNTLLSPPEQPGLIFGSLDAIVRGILGDKTRDRLGTKWTWLPHDKVSAYTRVLQAVGNSILVQVDALCQQQRHKRQLEQHGDMESDILKYTLSRADPNAICPNVAVKRPFSECTELTAKDVRDLWITLLGYEHDLALRAGNVGRAEQIKQAIKAAEEKRAGMVYVRPAMAYLRTSFPATSLQDNPNLTWDNMLGGHMMRSIPFGPQLHDFLDPQAKRDARINAEIDKQFWQNINRVRVAGGGDTNYVIAKDDIGNWYVKCYSANPKDVIKSAKSLAMFSLSAQMSADMIGGLNALEGKKETSQETDAAKSSLWPGFSKYRQDYKNRIKEDYDKLAEVLKEETIRKRIQKAWDENEALKDDIGPLRVELTKASAEYLERARQDVCFQPKTEEEDAERGTRIVKAIQKIRLFHNTLVDKVFERIVDGPAKDLEQAKIARDETGDQDKAKAEANVAAKQKELDKASYAGHVAQREVSRIVREEVVQIITSRKDAIKDYETAIMVIGESVRQ
jgi:hypothetical protein